MKFFWSEDRIADLRRLWPTRTGGELAVHFGGEATRNAIVGKANRMGLRKQAATGCVTPLDERDMNRLAEQVAEERPLHLAASRLGISIERAELLWDRIVARAGRQAA